MVPTDPRSSTDSRGTDFNQLLIAELDMQDAGATEAEINDMIARAVGTGTDGRTVRSQTVLSMLEQAAEMGVDVPRIMRRTVKAEKGRYIDEQRSK
jgi:hypothetical protein